jgi:hypothetical protein
MSTRKTGHLPARLEGLRQRFEGWRRTRKMRSRIPEPLWASAVKLADRYGTHRTAKALRVNYYALKKRAEGETATGASNVPPRGAGATFLELAPPARTGSCQCTLEFEDADGAKMRVHLKDVESPDLAALSRSFWQIDP